MRLGDWGRERLEEQDTKRMRGHETRRSQKIRTFEDLGVWQMGRDLTLKIYEITSHFPKEEVYGMTSQIKKAGIIRPQ